MSDCKKPNDIGKPTIFIVDNDEAVLESTATLLTSAGLRHRTYNAADDFLKECVTPEERRRQLQGCLLLDIHMPGLGGFELQRRLNELEVNLPIIFISAHSDVPMAVQAMKSGALDFLPKPFRDQELLSAIYQALEFNKQRSHQQRHRQQIRSRIQNLSGREAEVMRRMVKGQLTKVIASELNLSPRTIEIHRANVMEKMQAKTLAQLVQLVMEAGELD